MKAVYVYIRHKLTLLAWDGLPTTHGVDGIPRVWIRATRAWSIHVWLTTRSASSLIDHDRGAMAINMAPTRQWKQY